MCKALGQRCATRCVHLLERPSAAFRFRHFARRHALRIEPCKSCCSERIPMRIHQRLRACSERRCSGVVFGNWRGPTGQQQSSSVKIFGDVSRAVEITLADYLWHDTPCPKGDEINPFQKHERDSIITRFST